MSRGRKSVDALSVVPLIPGQGRPEPPRALDKAEKAVWRAIVGAMPPNWFGSECQPVLRRLCAQVVVSEGLEEQLRRECELIRFFRILASQVIDFAHAKIAEIERFTRS